MAHCCNGMFQRDLTERKLLAFFRHSVQSRAMDNRQRIDHSTLMTFVLEIICSLLSCFLGSNFLGFSLHNSLIPYSSKMYITNLMIGTSNVACGNIFYLATFIKDNDHNVDC